MTSQWSAIPRPREPTRRPRSRLRWVRWLESSQAVLTADWVYQGGDNWPASRVSRISLPIVRASDRVEKNLDGNSFLRLFRSAREHRTPVTGPVNVGFRCDRAGRMGDASTSTGRNSSPLLSRSTRLPVRTANTSRAGDRAQKLLRINRELVIQSKPGRTLVGVANR